MKKLLKVFIVMTIFFVPSVSNIGIVMQAEEVSTQITNVVDSTTQVPETTVTTQAVKVAPPASINEIFPDPALAEVVAVKLDMDAADQVSAAELESITELGDGATETDPITSLDGLQYCTNLEMLDFYDTHDISDLTPISDLTSLTTVIFPFCNISDLTPLSGLSNLKILDLRENQVSDLTPLSGLTNLQTLNLSDNSVSDLEPLTGLINMDDLRADNNNISDLTPLSGMTNMDRLELKSNNISDLTPISGMTKMRHLHMEDNQISDLTPLSGLTSNLFWVGLSDNNISDLTPLSGFTDLELLNLDGNNISDLTPLSGLNVRLSSELTLNDQHVTKPTQIISERAGGNFTLENEVKDPEGNLITPTTISNSGVYSAPQINWMNLIVQEQTVSYSWSQTVTVGEASTEFSGTVEQPLIVEILEEVAYDLNGGTGTVPTEPSHPENETFTVASQGDIERTGYGFAGWNTKADGSGTHYDTGSTFIMGAEPVVLYAEWSEVLDPVTPEPPVPDTGDIEGSPSSVLTPVGTEILVGKEIRPKTGARKTEGMIALVLTVGSVVVLMEMKRKRAE